MANRDQNSGCALFRSGGILTGTLFVLACLATLASAADSPVYESELIFPLNPQHNHAPGVAELPSGELIATWYRGSGERSADDVAVWGSRLKPGTKEWTKDEVWADTPLFPDCNTCLMADAKGRLTLYWPVIIANSWESALTCYKIADDASGDGIPKWTREGFVLLKPADFKADGEKLIDEFVQKVGVLPEKTKKSFDEARVRVGDKLYQRLGWQPRCKPTVLPSGRILLPLYSDTYSASIMAISDDGGLTWVASQPMFGLGNIQPSVLRRKDGSLVAYMRENGITGKVRVSESRDDGMTWSPVTSSELPNPGSGLDGVVLANGHWALVYNDTNRGRNSLAVSISKDEGKTWAVTRHLEKAETGSYHYPTMIQGKDGRIHCVYSYFVEGGKSMKHAAFNEAWVEAGDT